MKALFCFLPCLTLALLVSGCSREREISGQIFVVTKNRDNVKMGLVAVHAVTEAQLKTIGVEVLKRYKQARQEHEQILAQARADLEKLSHLEADLNALVPSGLVVPEVVEIKAEVVGRRKKVEANLNDLGPVTLRDTKDRLFKELPPAVVKTDADGRFTLKTKEKVWLLAQAERSIGKNVENYFWADRIDPNRAQVGSVILLSNDSLIDGPDGELSFLSLVSGESLAPMPRLTVQASQDLSRWTNAALERIKPSAAAAKIRMEQEAREQAMAEERERLRKIAEAKSTTEKRMVWTGKAMRRSGFREDTIDKTLTKGGVVIVWGDNEFNQCAVPLGLAGVVAIAAGAYHTLALKQDGTVLAWGENGEGQCDVPSNLSGVVAIAAGRAHSVALRQDGSVVAWGDNGEGQSAVPAKLSGVVAVVAGGEHTVALKQDGTLAAWGSNRYGICTVPAGLSDVVAVAAGSLRSIALKLNGTMVAWGHNSDSVPTLLCVVVAIAAGDSHTVALEQDGTLVAWGYNGDGQCSVPVSLRNVVAIAAGASHTVVLKQDGMVLAWGANDEGQSSAPASLKGVVAVAAGEKHTVALKLD